MKTENICDLAGNTPHVRVHFPEARGSHIYIKLESFNPTGSIKDRACLGMIRDKLARHQLHYSMTLLDASSGNMACAIAYYGKLLGYAVLVVANSKLTAEKR